MQNVLSVQQHLRAQRNELLSGSGLSSEWSNTDSAAVCNLFCIRGLKCVVAVPANCTECAPVAKCVPQECNTECILPCPFNNTCVLTATDCCPVPGCRPNTPSTSNQS
ncbi:unnamed protein product [Nippostrongylus brasiliensis]|uniref:TIL domain-containing protein n=1 Tax=Nippostrongylus brasiliensis TaxID=27835 RepID=A0A0N4Y049_NIPBR|nr:unnamed protein product [Nippostrongylus brasiliensis]